MATKTTGMQVVNSTVDSTPIGQTTPEAVSATTLTASGQASLNGGATTVTPASSDNSTKVATTAWNLLGFVISLGASGYIKFPTWLGGLIIQWLIGVNTFTANQYGSNTENWPVSFTNACLWAFPGVSCDSSPGSNNAMGYAAYLLSFNSSSITAFMDVGADGVGKVDHRLIAFGIGH